MDTCLTRTMLKTNPSQSWNIAGHAKMGSNVCSSLQDPDSPWPASNKDSGADGERIQRLRQEVCETSTVAFFRDPENLARLIAVAVGSWYKRKVQGLLEWLEKTKVDISVGGVVHYLHKTDVLMLDKPASKILLESDVYRRFGDRNRLPVVDDAGRIRYLIHRSQLDLFLVQSLLAPGTTQLSLKELTLEDMLGDPCFKSPNCNLLQDGKGDCSLTAATATALMVGVVTNIFATEDGTSNTTAIGWLTDIALVDALTINFGRDKKT